MKKIEPPNYTQIPNSLLDSLDKFSSKSELKVVLVIARKTFGWHKGRDIISLTQLEEATGLARQSILDGIELAIEHGWIERRAAGQSWSYAMVVQKLDPPAETGSPETRLEVVQKLDQQLVQKLDTQKKEEKKERNDLFDAVASVCAADAKLQGSQIGTVAAQLKDAGYTAEDVRAFGDDWWAWDQRTKAPSVWKLRDGISQVKAKRDNSETFYGLPEGV